jgi:hypothetical protein
MILQLLIAMVAGWVPRHQQQVISYLIEKTASSKLSSAAAGCVSPTRNAGAWRP